jgi:hypothetical protein
LTTVWGKLKKEYNKEDIIDYLSSFEGLSLSNSKISKHENGKLFIIKEVSILDKVYDLKLYPSSWNSLKVLNKGTDVLVSAYDLDNMQFLLKERYNWAKPENKNKYDFKNFFKEKFKRSSSVKVSSTYDKCYLENKISDGKWWCKEVINDSSAITVIKRDKLIAGEFSIIKDFFTIKYENLDVNIKGSSFDIKIRDALINSSIEDNGIVKNYSIIFSSNYDLEKHIFSNISLKVKNPTIKVKNSNSNNKNTYLFNGAQITFKLNKVKIWELEVFSSNLLKQVTNINNIYRVLKWSIVLYDTKISILQNKIYLKFENNWKYITIKIIGDKIISVIKDWNNILDKEINTSEINSILDKLK